jgi:predicted nucleic acid-binding Zn finger protein
MTTTQQVGKPERRGSDWWVPSATGNRGYHVELKPRPRCTCPSFVHRHTRLPGGICKHIRAAKEASMT